MTFIEQVGRSQDAAADEVASKNEAKKLAFYLFWNMKPVFSRWATRGWRSSCQAGCFGWTVGACCMGWAGEKGWADGSLISAGHSMVDFYCPKCDPPSLLEHAAHL